MTTKLTLCTIALTLFSASSFAYANEDQHDHMDDGHTLHIQAPHEFGTRAGTLSTQSINTLDLHFDVLNMELANRAAITTPLKVRIDKLINFSSTIKNKVHSTQRVLDAIFDSQEFYDAVINHVYQGRKQFADNRGYSNQDIYNLIQLGKEKMSKRIDRQMNLKLKLYYENSDTVGWTYSNSDIIHVNRKFYGTYTEAKIARNLMHEWLHNMGFSHDSNVTNKRRYSVPYAIGDIVEKLARRYR